MSIGCAVGKGKSNDGGLAGQQAAESCRQTLGTTPPDLLLLFASSHYPLQSVLDAVRKTFPTAPLVGCSTAGEIYAQGPDEHSVALAAFTGMRAEVAVSPAIASNAMQAGADLAQQYRGHPGKLLLTLMDGMAGDSEAFIRGLQAGLGLDLPVIGGAAGDDSRFERTAQCWDRTVVSGQAVAALLDGDFHFGMGVRHGWEPVGLPVHVTRSCGNLLQEINHAPAMRLYEEYFGAQAQRMREGPLARMAVYYPLGLAAPESEEFLLRAPLRVAAEDAISFTAEVPEGAEVRLMIGSVQRAIEAARIAAMEALAQMKGRLPAAAILFNCVARRRLFGRHAAEEVQAVQDILGQHVPVVGFYTYGEIAPFEGLLQQPSHFHNETVVILTLG